MPTASEIPCRKVNCAGREMLLLDITVHLYAKSPMLYVRDGNSEKVADVSILRSLHPLPSRNARNGCA